MRFLKVFTVLLLGWPTGLALSQSLTLEPLTRELSKPVSATHAGDGSGRLFVVQLSGQVRVFQDGQLLLEPFFSLGGEVTALVGEQGFYSLTFHPDYAANGRFFVCYTEAGTGDIVVAEHRVSADPDRAEPGAGLEVLRVTPTEPFHHGGQLAFGLDGYLYVSIGDGIFSAQYLHASPPNAQDVSTLGGKLLRLDVDVGAPYAVPPDNPFAGQEGARGEIYAYGFRNPWKFSFDRVTGELYVVDVGNDRWEEVNLVTAGGNYGWPAKEGAECFEFYDTYTPVDPDCPGSRAYTDPLHSYPHLSLDETGGNAVTGGYVYRGEAAAWQGVYLFGDFVSGRIWSLRRTPEGAEVREEADLDAPLSAFAEDEASELYVLTMDGGLYKLVLGAPR